MLKFDTIPHDDKATYKLLEMGLTKGVFQLEEHLGERYSAVVKPKTIADIADIISIIRPGCKEAKHVDGETSMLDAYCKIRNGQMEEAYLHEDLRPILGKTHSVLIYQEQIIEICRHIAGMSLQEGDMVRKAMGKKKPEEMAQWKERFVSGCVSRGYDQELSDKMWEWIDKAAGYLFNKSHAVAYATIAYKTAYAKTNYPTQFYCAMLKYADKKTDTYEEMLDLINDAKLFDIAVIPPKITEANTDFLILNKNTIAYGIKYLKGVGQSSVESIERLRGCSDWIDFLVKIDRFRVDKTCCEALIKAGALDEFELPRTQMWAQYNVFRNLTNNEAAVVLSLLGRVLHPAILIDIDAADFEQKRTATKYAKLHRTGIFDICGKYGSVSSLPLKPNDQDFANMKIDLPRAIEILIEAEIPVSSRRAKLQEMLNEYKNTDYGVNRGLHQLWEKHYFGIALTSQDKGIMVSNDCIPCIEVINQLPDANIRICGIIERVSYARVKRGESAGRTMAFIDIADNSFILKGAILFAEAYEKHADLVLESTPVKIYGRKMKQGNSIIVNSLEKI